MGGINPYIESAKYRLPTRPYRISFRHAGGETVVEVDPSRIPYGRDGLPGGILEIALAHGLALDHACGGVCACSTCHVIVRQGIESCNEASDAELDQLDNAPGLTSMSRLGCQSVPDGSQDLAVEVPGWNRNLAKEEHH